MTDFSGFDVFSEKAAVADADRVQLLDPELLYPDPENVRSAIDEATIDEMAETRSEEHTSELQSLMRISYAVFCLKKKNKKTTDYKTETRYIQEYQKYAYTRSK